MEIKIGSHVSNNGSLMLLGSVNEALSYGENCFMLYLGAPQNTFRKPFNELRAKVHLTPNLVIKKKLFIQKIVME